MRTSTTLNCPLHLCQAGDCQHPADCCLDREAYILPLYQTFCLECCGSGRVRYYSSDDPEEQMIEDLMETSQVEPCPDCDGDGSLWFDDSGHQWSRERDRA